MSHKSGTVIINRVAAAGDSVDTVKSASVELQFPSGTSLEDRMKMIRKVELLLDKLDHNDA